MIAASLARPARLLPALLLAALSAGAEPRFESAPVHPLEITPDGTLLLAVNTDDHRLSVFDLTRGDAPVLIAEVPVGLEPVTVRARGSREAWVVNRVSDSISVVDLIRFSVVRTLRVGDEPTDVAFAGEPLRAFVCLSGEDAVRAFLLGTETGEAVTIPLDASEPRSLAVSADGRRVFVAVLDSGNRTTTVPPERVAAGPGLPFPRPSMSNNLPPAPAVGLIVRHDGEHWVDELGRVWDAEVPYTLLDRDVIEIDADAAAPVRAFSGVGTALFNLAVNPVTGRLYVGHQDAHNEIRFEPNLRGRFATNAVSVLDPASGTVTRMALNPHLTAGSSGSEEERALSLAMPLDLLPAPDGDRVYVAAFGSAQVGVLDADGRPVDRIPCGNGPCGLALDGGRLYVLHELDRTLGWTDRTGGDLRTVPLGFDPVSPRIRRGRRLFYEARTSSSHGNLSCATCHLFAGRDGLAWDLGDPRGTYHETTSRLGTFSTHPMKGPMVTQSLESLRDTMPFHWRGDRPSLASFNATFVTLLGRPGPLSAGQMEDLTAFLLAVEVPPNPFRNPDNSLPDPGNGPSAVRGRRLFRGGGRIDGLACTDCHRGPAGGADLVVSGGSLGLDGQDMAVPSLLGLHEKTRFDPAGPVTVRGFGFGHNGSLTLSGFLRARGFRFADEGDERDIEAYLLAFGSSPHAGTGEQWTFETAADPEGRAWLAPLAAAADGGGIGLAAKGRDPSGAARGWAYRPGGSWIPDRSGEAPLDTDALLSLAGRGSELTLTAVPAGWEDRLGVDHDGDGFRDRDELDRGADPGDPASIPDAGKGGAAALGPAFPNPARDGARIAFTVARPGRVDLTVLDVRGRKVRTLLARPDHPEGFFEASWDLTDDRGRRAPAGIYFFRLAGPGGVSARRVVVVG